jgi:hypothetical protein
VKAEVKFVYHPSPEAMRRPSSRDEEKRADLLPEPGWIAVVNR